MFSPNKSAQSFLEGLIILKQSCSSNLEEIHIVGKKTKCQYFPEYCSDNGDHTRWPRLFKNAAFQ